jgi:hypothetical protein
MLDALLEKATGSGSDDKWRYQITLLKKVSQSTRPSKIKANLADLQSLMALYLEFKPVVNQLGLSYEFLRYYAYSVVKDQIHQVSRRAKEDRYLHLIAFIVYQTLKLQDMLIDVLLLAVQSAINATYNEHKETCYQEMESRNQSVTQLVDGLQNDFISTLGTIKAIIADTGLTADQKVVAIEVTINRPASKKTGIEQRINDFKDELTALQQQASVTMTYSKNDLSNYKAALPILCGRRFLVQIAASHCYWKPSCITRKSPAISTSRHRLSF